MAEFRVIFKDAGRAFNMSLAGDNDMDVQFGNAQVIQAGGILSNTTEQWNSQRDLIAARNTLYVYTDHEREEMPDGAVTLYPGVKIGDGTSYLIDMPFSITGSEASLFADIDEHIKNMRIHVGESDREAWDEKVSASVNESSEELVLSIRR